MGLGGNGRVVVNCVSAAPLGNSHDFINDLALAGASLEHSHAELIGVAMVGPR
jgi:hypothetical protein